MSTHILPEAFTQPHPCSQPPKEVQLGHVARCTVERLIWGIGLHSIRRAKSARTTCSAPWEQCPADLVNRHFSAFKPNELWGAEITYIRTFSRRVYLAFVTDVCSRRIAWVGRPPRACTRTWPWTP